MILSPPFLPGRLSAESDEQYVERAMTGGDPGEGSFPVSYLMNWHGGVHLTAPAAGNQVRAIADGTVVFRRSPTPLNNQPLHPLNYRGGWTDDGCVILRHQTEIGADATSGQPTVVVFYSIYMHLGTVAADFAQGNRVYRKHVLGTAGQIYGTANRIQFEIICDDANVQRLTGRNTTYNDTSTDGRTDAVFGAMHFLLLTDTPFLDANPADAHTPPATAFTNTEAMFVVMRFVQGDCAMRSLHLDGRPIDNPVVESGYEYNLFSAANALCPNSPAAAYDLLRFGRVLGPDALNPAGTAHWRRVAYPGGTGWVNLNAPTVKKFSDADFPMWDYWWMLIDASSSADSRCRDVKILELLDNNGDLNVTPQEAQQNLADPDLRLRLSHKICKFPTEWAAATIDARWSWLKTDPQTRMDEKDYARFKAHVTALSFWEQAQPGIDGVHWHFHPSRFIIQFRQCGWLSLDELSQLLPRRAGSTQGKLAAITWATAQSRFSPYQLHLNRAFRRYNILDPRRQIHFLAQTYIETALWQTMREFGTGHQQHHPDGTPFWPAPMMEFYTVFYGRGAMQLTWPFNYDGYGTYRHYANVGPHYIYTDGRITHTSLHQWSAPPPTDKRLWFSRYDPEIVADDSYAACDSAGYFWVSKNIGHHQININRVADQPFTTQTVGRISVLVNGGGFGFAERESFAAFLKRYRDDDTATTTNETFNAQHGNTTFHVFVDYTPQRP
jgi:hydroxyethylthiazole kinase